MDFHTHNLAAPVGTAIVNLPREWLHRPALFLPAQGGLYSVGIHPWWTADGDALPALFEGLEVLLDRSGVVAVGECGLDRLRGGDMALQERVFARQVAMADARRLPVTVHCVRAFDRLLHLHKMLRPATRWTVHGFRGAPALARQLLDAGMDLSFGVRHNAESLALTPPERRHRETDEDF